MEEVHSEKNMEFNSDPAGLLKGLLGRAGLIRPGRLGLFLQVLIVWLVTWFPLLMLSLMQGRAWSHHLKIPFLYDFSIHIRFFIVVPLFILAGIIIQPRLKETIQEYTDEGLIKEADLARYGALVQQLIRFSNSIVAECILVAIVVVAAFAGLERVLAGSNTWHVLAGGDPLRLSMAGQWFFYVSLPFLQFLILRFLWRYFVYCFFLWRTSRLDLNLNPLHPDRVGGLSFVGNGQLWLRPFVTALSAIFASSLGAKIVFERASLMAYKVQIGVFIALLITLLLAPLFVFSMKLRLAKRKGILTYGDLASRYVASFERKWVRGEGQDGESFLGTGDIQSLADMGNSYSVVEQMKIAPVDKNMAIAIAVSAVIPMLPLLLTVYPLSDLLEVLKGILL